MISATAFNNCSKLSKITLSKNLTNLGTGLDSIGLYAFKDFLNLSSIQFSDCIKNLYMGCFYNCGFTGIVLPNTINTLSNKVFQACKKLQSISISSSVTLLPEYALYGCTVLNTVVIPNSIKQIGDFAFNASTKLANVYYTGSSNEWELISINKDKNQVLCNLTVTFNYIVE